MCLCALPGKAISEMTYTVSGGTLNPTYSLTHFFFLFFCLMLTLAVKHVMCNISGLLFNDALHKLDWFLMAVVDVICPPSTHLEVN